MRKFFLTPLFHFSTNAKPKLKQIKIVGFSNNHETVTSTFDSTNKTITESSPLELLLYSLISCENATFRFIAQRKKVKIGKIDFSKVEALYDVRGFTGEDPNNRFSEINIRMEVESEAGKEKIEEMVGEMKKQCPIYWMIHQSGVAINTEVVLK
jgi:uncharacterized OsmC-like protein